jgi:two-component SAPR family response regulator
MALIRGDFLEGWQTGLFEDAREEARNLIELVYTKIAAYLVDTEPERAFDLSRKTLDINPFSEEACELAINALLRLGKYERAKELYDNFVKRFRAELKMPSRLSWPPPR